LHDELLKYYHESIIV